VSGGVSEDLLQTVENKTLQNSQILGDTADNNSSTTTKRCTTTRKKFCTSTVEGDILTEAQRVDLTSTAPKFLDSTTISGRDVMRSHNNNKLVIETIDNAMTSGQPVDPPQYNVRTWFKDLPSGKDRAAASAITDATFIKMFLDIACKSQLDEEETRLRRVSNTTLDLGQANSNINTIIKESASVSLEDMTDLSNTYNTRMSLVDKLSHDARIVTTDETESPSRVVNSDGNVYDSTTPDAKIEKDKEKVKENPPVEEIPSTAFRIRPTNNHDEEKYELSNKTPDEPMLTTLHFDSGLTLPVSSTSESNKIAIASSAAKTNLNARESKSETSSFIPKLGKLGKNGQLGDDVHQKLNFSALNILTSPSPQCRPPPSDGNPGNKKKQKERISRSKLSASRAMQSLAASDKETDSVEAKLLQHVRLVFTSALTVVENSSIDDEKPHKEGIEVLTLDPCYLEGESEAGLNLFNDAQYIIDSQYAKRKISGHSTDELVMDESCHFLNNGRRSDQNGPETKVSWPEWLLPVIESKDPSIHLLLILLAKVELSIQDSHNQYIQTFQLGNEIDDPPIHSCSPDTDTTSKLPSPSTEDKKVDIVCDNLSSCDNTRSPPIKVRDALPSIPVQEVTKKIPSLDLIYRQKLQALFTSSGKSSASVGEHFQNILKTWAHLKSEKDSSHPTNINLRELIGKDKLVDGNELKAEDLVLVPLSFVVSSTSMQAFHERCHNIQQLAKKWNEIILSGLSHVQKTISSVGEDGVVGDVAEETKTVDSVDNILVDDESFLFKNDSVKVSGKKKKKKKRRKKRKLAMAARNGDTCQGSSITAAVGKGNVASEQNNILKIVCELSNKIRASKEELSNKAVSPHTSVKIKTIDNSKGKAEETKSDATQKNPNRDVTTLNTNLTVSLVNGVNGTCVVGGGRLEEDELENSDAWETVEPKGGRGNTRNKKLTSDAPAITCQPLGHGRKTKTKTKGLSRQRISQRRKGKDVVKEIVKDNAKDIEHSILESVDEDIERGLKNTHMQRKERKSRYSGDRPKKQGGPANPMAKGMSPGRNARAASCRDVVMGHIASNPPFRIPASRPAEGLSHQLSSSNSSTKIKAQHVSQSNVGNEESDAKLKTQKSRSMLSADQNTATTVPDTISNLSATTPSTSNTDEHKVQIARRETSGIKCVTMSNSKSKESTRNSHGGGDESSVSGVGDKRIGRSENKVSKSTAPLLQTVIGPRDIDSVKSSVASSLEATREDDVGYHLLKSCEKLSDDMVSFMDRRASALDTKRRERNLLLAALQETLQSIWSGRCCPEIYGSCATKLDLPSSDMDVVIRMLNHEKEDTNLSTKTLKRQTSESSNEAYVAEMNTNIVDKPLDSPSRCSQKIEHISHNNSYRDQHQFYPPLSKNGIRVMRLATELETQPWAVQVNPIPTASVPLLKILADPSRLPCATTAGMDWIVHHQHMAAAVAAEMNSTSGIQQTDELSGTPTDNETEFCRPPPSHLAAMTGLSSPPYHTAPAPWRGADVMNGLLSLDITFEGSEHGGLGSTEYTNRVVDQACRETGLPPESTPAVQVLVVIKELLAQRRLNEPFSGGLSSYAILLLVVAVMKERRIIKSEIDRVERQRRAVASESNAAVTEIQSQSYQAESNKIVWPTPKQQSSLNSSTTNDGGSLKSKNQGKSSHKMNDTDKIEKSAGWDQGKPQLTRKSSWAAIAKKSVTPRNTTQRFYTSTSDRKKDARKSTTEPSGVNFRNAVTEGNTSNTVDIKPDCIPPVSAAEGISEQTDLHDSPLFPQGSNDVLEVLCSGEPTAGKLLMHFLLFYGRHFDSQTTCIDLEGKHYPELSENGSKPTEQSPFLPRKAGGFYNPVTKVYTVDPVVVYDPWGEAEVKNNVARSCFAWGNIRCVFEQCFNTLSGAVERGNGTGGSDRGCCRNSGGDQTTSPSRVAYGGEPTSATGVSSPSNDQRNCTDDVSPLLELLLSF